MRPCRPSGDQDMEEDPRYGEPQHSDPVPSTYHPKDANPGADGSHCGNDVKLPSLVRGPEEKRVNTQQEPCWKGLPQKPRGVPSTVSWSHSLLPRVRLYIVTQLLSGALGFDLGSAYLDTGR